jgi:hypothetical protein
MARLPDYYEILQVSPNADEEIIKVAFKRLALKWHPDKRPDDPAASRRMMLLNRAYEVLSNPRKRQAYNLRRSRAAARSADADSAPPVATQPERPESAPVSLRAKKRRSYFRDASVVQDLAVLLVVLSLADLLTTYQLLRISPRFYEANPVAGLFFQRWNMVGMTLFKFALVGFVIALGEVIERHRPGWGRFVLGVGCIATAIAIVRGLQLYLGVRG